MTPIAISIFAFSVFTPSISSYLAVCPLSLSLYMYSLYIYIYMLLFLSHSLSFIFSFLSFLSISQFPSFSFFHLFFQSVLSFSLPFCSFLFLFVYINKFFQPFPQGKYIYISIPHVGISELLSLSNNFFYSLSVCPFSHFT